MRGNHNFIKRFNPTLCCNQHASTIAADDGDGAVQARVDQAIHDSFDVLPAATDDTVPESAESEGGRGEAPRLQEKGYHCGRPKMRSRPWLCRKRTMDAMGNCRRVNVWLGVWEWHEVDFEHLATGAAPDAAQHGQQVPATASAWVQWCSCRHHAASNISLAM